MLTQLFVAVAVLFVTFWLFNWFKDVVQKDTPFQLKRLPIPELLARTQDPRARLDALRVVHEHALGAKHQQVETEDCLRALLDALETSTSPEVTDVALAALARVCRSDAVIAKIVADQTIIDRLLAPIRASLAAEKAAVDEEDEEEDEAEPTPERRAAEETAAEVQRKAALLLGAIADGHVAGQSALVDAGALKPLVDAMEWFALHRALQQWALWALFTLTYEHPPNKFALVELGGLERTIRAMRAHGAELEIQRHGLLVLFSCLRSDRTHDTFAMRAAALNAGMKDAVRDAVDTFGESDRMIQQMGTGILKAIDDDAV